MNDITHSPAAAPTGSVENAPSPEPRSAPPLSALLRALEDLERSLAQEGTALAGGDADRLLDAVETKRRALASLETLLRSPEFEPLLRDPFAPDSPLSTDAAWPALLEKLEACRSSNEAIGGALHAALRSTETSLKWLGLAADSPTYGDGPSSTTRRDLAIC